MLHFGKKQSPLRMMSSVTRPSNPNREALTGERAGWKKRKVALVVGYVGTGYHGLQFNQKMAHLPTIEGEVEDALFRAGHIAGSNYRDLSKIGWSRSSRTDKGVHAARLVLNAKLLVSDAGCSTHSSCCCCCWSSSSLSSSVPDLNWVFLSLSYRLTRIGSHRAATSLRWLTGSMSSCRTTFVRSRAFG
jgi:hypothetical protein